MSLTATTASSFKERGDTIAQVPAGVVVVSPQLADHLV